MLFTESFRYLQESGFQDWMTDALSQMNIKDVQAEYQPTDKKEPLIWRENSRLLIIHEPDPFTAALYFLEWTASELPKQWRSVWENLQRIERKQGKKASENALNDYIRAMEAASSGSGWRVFK